MAIRIFGDSFSTPFNFNYNLDLRFCVDYLKLCLKNGDIPKDWIELLKENGKDSVVYSIPGTDNLTIFESVLRRIPEFDDNEIVIIGWTTLDRVRSYEKTINFYTQEEIFLPVLMAFEEDKYILKKIKEHKDFFKEWLIYKSSHPNSPNELIDWIEIINKLLKIKNNKVIHWFWNPYQFGYNRQTEPLFEKLDVYNRLTNLEGFINLHFGESGLWNQYDNNAVKWDIKENNRCSYINSIYYSTGKQIIDCHWDLKGHEIFFNIINNEIEKIYKR